MTGSTIAWKAIRDSCRGSKALERVCGQGEVSDWRMWNQVDGAEILPQRNSRSVVDLLEELAAHCFGKILVARDRHDEAAGSCLNIIAIPLGDVGLLVENGKTVDDDAARHRHDSRLADENDGFVRRRFAPVTRYVHDLPPGGNIVAIERTKRTCDPRADAGRAGLAAR